MAATPKVSRLTQVTATAAVRIREAIAIARLMSTADEANTEQADLQEAAGVMQRLLTQAQESIDEIDSMECRGQLAVVPK